MNVGPTTSLLLAGALLLPHPYPGIELVKDVLTAPAMLLEEAEDVLTAATTSLEEEEDGQP